MCNEKKLYLLSGIPGSGKSTWAKNYINTRINRKVMWCSRDNIRFSLLKDSDNYFAHEDEVLANWYAMINDAITDSDIDRIIVDATHLTRKARERTLSNLKNLDTVTLIGVEFDVPIGIAIERNNKREGRAKVPETIIYNMAKSYTSITHDEFIKNHYAYLIEGET